MTHINRTFLTATSGLIFIAVALLHGYRAAQGFDLMYGTYLVPIWISWLVVLVALLLALNAFRHL